MDTLIVLKIIILGYIVLSPFLSYKYMTFVNATPIKILILLLIVLVSFIDLQLAVLLMIAFLILLVNLNKEVLVLLKNKVTSEESGKVLLSKVLSEIKTIPEQMYVQDINKQEIASKLPVITMPTSQKETMVRGNSLFPLPSDTMEVPNMISEDIPQGVTERFVDVDMEIDPRLDFRMQRAGLQNQVQEQIREQSHEPVHAQTMYNFPAPYCKNLEHLDPYLISNNMFLYSTDDRTKAYEEYVRVLSPEEKLEIIQTNVV